MRLFFAGTLTIALDEDCKTGRLQESIYCNGYVKNEEHLLKIMGKEKSNKKACLSYLFTNRKEFGALLGLAYIGGACDAR